MIQLCWALELFHSMMQVKIEKHFTIPVQV